jgi:hypothetical protein
MSCCGQGTKGFGHFGAYQPVSAAQVMSVTGSVQGTPNETGGMHTQYAGARNVSGLGDLFNFQPAAGDWISGVPNGYITAGAIAILVMVLMKR